MPVSHGDVKSEPELRECIEVEYKYSLRSQLVIESEHDD